ncbi:hypothetical protein ACFVVX_09355 [Kitasatospora sp. NPDC058170]|uniref:hypothetical protein n=1 Tax=Kitasatospora sp. NPDC058170 TaxID=3346364 RepID=UPI0036DCE21B
MAQRPDGSFSWANLNIVAGRRIEPGIIRPAPFPALTGGLSVIAWGVDSRRVYYADTDGAVVELGCNGKGWEYRNFTSEFAAPAAAWNSPFAAGGWRSGKMSVYYVTENRELAILLFDSGWQLGVDSWHPRAAPGRPLAALQNGRGRFAYYFDDDNHLREVEEFGTRKAQGTDLTDFAKLRPASLLSGMAAVGWGEDSRRIYFGDAQDNLMEAIGYGDSGNRWSSQDLGGLGAKRLDGGSPLAAATTGDALGGVAMWCQQSKPIWLAREGGWSSEEIYTTEEGVRPVVSANSSVACAVSASRQPWVAFVSEDDHLCLWRGPERDWSWWDLTAELGLPPVARVAAQGPLALAHTEGGPRVYYLTDEPEF